jgi:hypothetical protein
MITQQSAFRLSNSIQLSHHRLQEARSIGNKVDLALSDFFIIRILMIVAKGFTGLAKICGQRFLEWIKNFFD